MTPIPRSLLRMLSAGEEPERHRKVTFGFVPGRIEVFGRHTDYAGGRTIVCSIERGFTFAVAPRRDLHVSLREDSTEFSEVEFELDPRLMPKVGTWSNYPITMARRLTRNFPGVLRGVDVVFSSNLPVGSGMSGSSALMMMVFTALAVSNRLETDPRFRQNILTPIDLAVYLACAENGQSFRGLEGDGGVGTFGGSEDHAAILTARADCLSLFGFSPPQLLEEAAWPRAWSFVVAFSGVRAEKTREAREKYNLASRRVQDAVRVFNALHHTRHATLRDVVDDSPPSDGWLDHLDSGPGPRAPALADRVRQFILEDRTHVPGAMAALRGGRLDEFGRLLDESHRASRECLWNIVPEIDFLQRSARELGAAGASGFGAGFGGSIAAVTTRDRASELREEWKKAYEARYPQLAGQSEFFVARPSPGIQLWTDGPPVRYVDSVFSR